MSTARDTETAAAQPSDRAGGPDEARRRVAPVAGCLKSAGLEAVVIAAWAGLLAAGLAGRPYGFCGVDARAGWTASAGSSGLALLRSGSPLPWSPWAAAPGMVLMLLATMAPLLRVPLAHVRQRSFSDRLGRSVAWFLAGYGAVWLAGGLMLQAAAVWLVWQLDRAAFAVAVSVALAWQCSPWKQASLNACHRRPVLPAFARDADFATLGFGVRLGLSCFGTCWAAMALPWFGGRWMLPIMAAVALFLLAERQERPAAVEWAPRLPRRWVRGQLFLLRSVLRH